MGRTTGAWVRGAGPSWGGAAAAATNELNETGGTARFVLSEWSAPAGRARAGPEPRSGGTPRVSCSHSPAARGSTGQRSRGHRPSPGASAPGSRLDAQGHRRPAPQAAKMCDCFHVVLPTWPGAPGSGAPHPRLQPASLGRVGSAGVTGARSAGQAARVRKGRRDGSGLASGRAGLACFRTFAGSVGLCISLALVPTSCFHSPPPTPHLFSALSSSGFHYSVWLPARRTLSLSRSLPFSSRSSSNPLGRSLA